MKKSTKSAINLQIDDYTDAIITTLTGTAVEAHIAGDIIAYHNLKIPVAENVVQQAALDFGKGYRKLLKDEGASIIQGKKIPWLADHTKHTRDQVYDIVEAGLKEGKPVASIGGKTGAPGTIVDDLKQLSIRQKDYEYVRIARTETARVQNQGTLNRYTQNKITHVNVIDGGSAESCDECTAINGSTWTVEYSMTHELEHPNCLTKDIKVMGGFNGILRSYYSGPIVNIVTEFGRRLSVTPNHPILTCEGFISAKSIQKGSELVCYAPFVKDSSIYPDDKHEPIVIEEIFNMLSLLCVVERVPVSTEDLHSDAVCGDGYVDIIDMNRFLPYNFKTHVLKQLSDIFLESSAPDEVLLSRVCSHDFSVDCVFSPTAGFPSPREHLFFKPRGVPFGSPNHLNCLRAGSEVNSVIMESSFDNTFSAVEFLSNLRESNSRQIEIDHVVDITVREYDDYVYDLLTNAQYYNASGVFIHNCVRAFSPVIPDDWEPPG